jgi:hypothetical protein
MDAATRRPDRVGRTQPLFMFRGAGRINGIDYDEDNRERDAEKYGANRVDNASHFDTRFDTDGACHGPPEDMSEWRLPIRNKVR